MPPNTKVLTIVICVYVSIPSYALKCYEKTNNLEISVLIFVHSLVVII
jgi:hypothetical protein